jgi:polyisoprenoid-binding protein YceI|tara:strand:- start:1292 stop:2071 length:780 start_codon:yes stop_codon:yes gene_type:complete
VIRNLFGKKLKGNIGLMKRILIFILISNFAFGQLLDRSEKELIPTKRFDNVAKRQIDENLISPIIILDAGKSKFVWSGGLKFGPKTHNGKLRLLNGNINLDNQNISGEVLINMLSLTNSELVGSSSERLVGHLRSADFFDVEKYPTAKLSIKNSKVIQKLDDGRYKMLIDGEMTVKSKTNLISFEAIIDLDSEIKTAEGVLVFNRNDFGVQYRSEMHLNDPKSFWNKLQTTRDTAKDKVINEEIEIKFNVVSMPGMLSK